MDLAKTRSSVSIAEQMSLTREILFVFIVCMAQFMTRTFVALFIYLVAASIPVHNTSSILQRH